MVDELLSTVDDPYEAAEMRWGPFLQRFEPPMTVVTRRETHRVALLARDEAVVLVDYKNETMMTLRLSRGPWRMP